MNLLNNRRLIISGSVFLVLVSFTFFALQFFKQGTIEMLSFNELKPISSCVETIWDKNRSTDDQSIKAVTSAMPSFKSRTQPHSQAISNTEVDFPCNDNLESIEPTLKRNVAAKKVVENTNSTATYIYAPQNSSTTYASGIQNNSIKTSNFQTNNTVQSINTGIQSVAYLGTKAPVISNTANNSFLANNSLSLTTDLSDNNSLMLIGGDSNPGDPGIPVGDGTFVLLILLIGYGLIKISKWRLHPFTSLD
jgi:hypothetical protein